MTRDKGSLNKKEKQEIVLDVKKAFDKAKLNYNKKGIKRIVIPSVIIVLFIFLITIYWYFASNPRTLFIHSIENFSNTLEDSFDINRSDSGKIYINLNVKIGNEKINEYKYKIDYLIDDKRENSFLWKIYDKNNSLSKIAFYNSDKNYVYVPQLYNKYISFDDNYFNYNWEDTKIISKSIKKAFFKAINNYKISNTKLVLKLNKKHINTYKTSLFLNSNDINEIIDNINNNLKEDKKFKQSYTNIFKTEDFSELIIKIKEMFGESDNLQFNVYTEGLERSFVRLELIQLKNNKLNIFKITKLNNNKFRISVDDQINLTNDKYTIHVKKNKNKTVYGIHIIKEKNNEVVLDMKSKIKKIKTNNVKISNSSISDSLSYNNLNDEEKLKLDEKIEPIRILVDEVFKK